MEMIADARLSPCEKIGLHLGCLLRGNLFRPLKARFHWSAIKRAIKEALQAMTLHASTQPPPTSATSVAAVLRLPVIFGAEVRWDFPVVPAGKTDRARSRFRQARRTPGAIQGRTMVGIERGIVSVPTATHSFAE